jgi:hypothetical protein
MDMGQDLLRLGEALRDDTEDLIQFEIPDKDKFQQALKEAQEQLGCANERTRLGLYLLNGGTDFPALDADLDEVDDEEESLSAYDRRDIDLLRELKNAGESPWDESPKRVINNNPTRYILFDFFLSHAIKVMPRRSIDESIVTLMPFLDELEADLSTQWNPIHKNFFGLMPMTINNTALACLVLLC